jgi:class 3 adenylate cyclase
LTAIRIKQQNFISIEGYVLERKLAAILGADVFGHSRLMGDDEEGAIHTLSAHRRIIDALIKQHRGRFVGRTMLIGA